jgi:hypothetical protein
MSDDNRATGAPTRRECVKYDGVIGGGSVAGCSNRSDGSTGDSATEEFGEYRGPFEVLEAEQLFDRQRLAAISNGNLQAPV